MQRDTAMDQLLNESGGSKKKKRSTFMSALRDRGGSIAELTSSSKVFIIEIFYFYLFFFGLFFGLFFENFFKIFFYILWQSRKERRAKAKSMQIDKGFGKNFEIGTPTDFNKQV